MNKVDYENLGPKMKDLRIKIHLTQSEVAEALEVTPGYISNVENGRTAMSLRVLIYYARLLNITLDSLIGLIDSEYEGDAIDRDIIKALSDVPVEKKRKLLETIKIWTK